MPQQVRTSSCRASTQRARDPKQGRACAMMAEGPAHQHGRRQYIHHGAVRPVALHGCASVLAHLGGLGGRRGGQTTRRGGAQLPAAGPEPSGAGALARSARNAPQCARRCCCCCRRAPAGQPRYAEVASRFWRAARALLPACDGLYCTWLDGGAMQCAGREWEFSLGASSDSFYEYTLKTWVLTGGRDAVRGRLRWVLTGWVLTGRGRRGMGWTVEALLPCWLCP